MLTFADLVSLTVPSDATVLLVGDSDSMAGLSGSELLIADRRMTLDQLMGFRARGCQYLLLPYSSLGPPTVSRQIRSFLHREGRLLGHEAGAGEIYSLNRVALSRPLRVGRVVALLSVHNEERLIANCLHNLVSQGVEAFLLDHGSTDATVDIARRWLGRGLVGIESLPYDGTFRLPSLLQRKSELADTIEAEWLMHVDADEIHRSPAPGMKLAEALGAVQEAGYNAVNFVEFTFVPTRETPDHDHPRYMDTMRWYYPFLPSCPRAMRAWRGRGARVDLADQAGHRIRFPGMRLCPEFFPMRHYQFLSVPHACRKYRSRTYDADALRDGWHAGRSRWGQGIEPSSLPPQAELRKFSADHSLDASRPRSTHVLADAIANLEEIKSDDHQA